jgi:hypothetical protein
MKLSAKQSIKLNGPFYTGFFIDSATVIEKGYSNVQEIILEALNNQDAKGWTIEGSRIRSDLLYAVEFAQKTIYAGTPMIGQSFLTHKLLIENHEINFQGHRFVIKSIVSFYHDYGVGVYNLDIDIYLAEEIEISEYRSLVEQFSGTLNTILNPHIESDTLVLKEVLEANGIPVESYEEIAKELKEKRDDFIPIRKSLWFHRIFDFKVPEISRDVVQKFLVLLSSSQPSGPQNCSLSHHAAVYPGYGNSLLVYATKLDKPINLDRLIALAQFYYAATSLLDTILFNRFADFHVKKMTEPKIKEIEEDVRVVQQLSERLELFLLILKDSILNFSPDSTQMWKTLEAEWYYTPLLTALRDKAELLQHKNEELLDELTQKRQATLNRFVKIFTVFAIIGPIFEAWTFLESHEAETYQWLDFILANLAILLLIGIPIGVLLVVASYLIGKRTILRY